MSPVTRSGPASPGAIRVHSCSFVVSPLCLRRSARLEAGSGPYRFRAHFCD
jgi:hypothetical protein